MFVPLRSKCPLWQALRKDTAVDVEQCVVASAPDVLNVISVLDGAVQVGASGGEGLELPGWSPDQDSGLVAKLEDVTGVSGHIHIPHRQNHHIRGSLRGLGRDEEGNDRIEDG